MKRIKKIVSLAVVATLLTGCATSKQPRPNDPNHSRALNIALAADLRDIKDTKVSSSQYQSMQRGNVVFDAGWTWANYVNPAPGFTSGFGLGLGVASILFPQKSAAASNSLMAWIPADQALGKADAKEKILKAGTEAIENALERLNFRIRDKARQEHPHLGSAVGYVIEDPNGGCGSGEEGELASCAIVLAIDHIDEGYSPVALTGQSYPAYVLNSSSPGKRSILNIRSEPESKLNQVDLYLEISKEMPDWMAVYVAPKRALDGEGKENPMPFIALQGKIELFVLPE
ncbi:hypothetical protein [Alcaligenes faecalis]|uniref:hypothetical protein n=1 Tax=Alcaligenes faecalis TaxID=511 RepID=UPI0024BD523B|nr:hypothetical protein [Alcaligenes faecalis]WHQ45857.1 hypothetical protein E8D21_19550 [Alcaligenes faecalis]